tara:strand:- start:535 stop:870 length:336 start_codon:yes stop_codon:yes gene_type:complete
MPNDFINAGANLTNNTRTDVYQITGSGNTAVVHSVTVANTHGTSSVDVTLEVYDNSTTTYFPVTSTVPVPADSTLVLENVKLNLEQDDKICATSSNGSGNLTVFASILKIS